MSIWKSHSSKRAAWADSDQLLAGVFGSSSVHVVINQLWLSSPAPAARTACAVMAVSTMLCSCSLLPLTHSPPHYCHPHSPHCHPHFPSPPQPHCTALHGGVLRLCTEDKRQVAGQAGQAVRGYWSLRQPSLALSHSDVVPGDVISLHYTLPTYIMDCGLERMGLKHKSRRG